MYLRAYPVRERFREKWSPVFPKEARPGRVLAFIALGSLLALWGCGKGGPDFVAKDEPWRAEEEHACLAANVVRETAWIKSRSALGGPSVCGAARPFEMAAADSGRVAFKPNAMLRCPMVPQVDKWVARVINPAAYRYLGQPVVELSIASSYSCRPMNGQSGAQLSEHGHANALDVSAFTLADGRKVTVRAGWWGEPRERAFLRAVHAGACAEFTTVLGPEANVFHRDHFHVDLARHGKDGLKGYCK